MGSEWAKPPAMDGYIPESLADEPAKPGAMLTPTVAPLRAPFLTLAAAAMLLPGCNRLHPGGTQGNVYVISRGTYLRDRLAAISNHVEDIHNGERLQVVEHERRFYKVRTPDGKEGWLEEHAVIGQAEFDNFVALDHDHRNDPVLATGVLRDEIFLHLTPGRKTEHLYLLPANDKLQLLQRASVEKPLPPQALLSPKTPHPRRERPVRPAVVKKVESGSTVFAQAPPKPDKYTAPDLDPDAPWMAEPQEDWWLVRDAGGKVGWVLARGLDVDVPDEVAQYSEGRHIIGAYLLNTVYDNGEPPQKHIGPEEQERVRKRAEAKAAYARRHPKEAAEATDAAPPPPAPVPKQMGQYVTVTTEFKDGLPYDWDQVRVFIWNAKKHRYETAYRLREQQGYLPVTVGKETVDKMGVEPTFAIRTTPDGVVAQDEAGGFHPKTVNVTQYRLEGGIVRRDTPLPERPGEPEAGPSRPPALAKGTHVAGRTRALRQPK